ncbi:MAG: hypothetical protein K2O17_00795 [Bacteroidaceae bacterium]|nr:hypothetical protein [Bacteroidaceae bacterium]
MIRVAKAPNVPQSLTTTQRYDGEDVKRQLFIDHSEKCYLCERHLCTDFEIEHHKSKTHYPHLTQDWNNLYLTCRYCNGKKLENFDNTLHPATINIEDDIIHSIDFRNKHAKFTANSTNLSPKHQETIELLTRIYNGTGKSRKIKEERFFEYVIRKLNDFQQLIINYQKDSSSENESLIRKELQIDKECLGFKYWIIRNNATLYSMFAADMVWNKK